MDENNKSKELKNHGREEITHQKPGHSDNKDEVKESQGQKEIVEN